MIRIKKKVFKFLKEFKQGNIRHISVSVSKLVDVNQSKKSLNLFFQNLIHDNSNTISNYFIYK